MALSSLKIARPWSTSVRYLVTHASLRKKNAVQMVAAKETEKAIPSSSHAAGEDYFSGLITNLQANNFDNAPGIVTESENVDCTRTPPRPKPTQRVINQPIQSVTQKLMSEHKLCDDKFGPKVVLNSNEDEQFVPVEKSPPPVKETANFAPVASSVENGRMTLAGLADQEMAPRATLASVPPPALPFAQILSSVQTAIEMQKDRTLDGEERNVEPNKSSSQPRSSADDDYSTSENCDNVYETKTSPIRPTSLHNSESVDQLSGVSEENEDSLCLETEALSIRNDDDQWQDGSSRSLEKTGVPVDDVAPAFTPSFNLASFVNRSESLQQLVKLGVDLSVWDAKQGVAEYVLRLEFERDMKRHVRFLHDLGVPADDLGRVLTKNPFLFKQSLENLDIRINYLHSKRFTNDAIATIIVKSPVFINQSTKAVDERLGYLQQLFSLTGNEVREVVTRLPRLVTNEFAKIQQMHFTLLEEFGFSPKELKTMFIAKPKLWTVSRHAVQERFDYLHSTMGISHQLITVFPGALLCRKFIFMQRHLYLQHIGRAQYDPTKANYVSLKALVTGTDSVFCQTVAKTPVQQFNEFLKTL